MSLQNFDPAVARLIDRERNRQETHLELIASENYVSDEVLQAQGSVLTNKYAEGYPGKRYYGGCKVVDEIENLAIERARKLFNCEYVNVQPHSGSQANQAVFLAVLEPGDTILGMSLAHGGHLTHGASVNFSGKFYQAFSYGLDPDTETLDYAEMEALARQHKPKMIIAGASAYSRTLDFQRFRKICDEVGAYLMVDMAHYAGLIAAGLYPSPVGIADFITSTTHKTLRGPRGGLILAKAQYAALLDKTIFPVYQGGPLMHVIAAKAVAFNEALSEGFKHYQQRVIDNARTMADILTRRGLRVVSGGTDCHMFLLDLRAMDITGKDAEALLESAHITLNKNAIPNDPQKPAITSGIRIGTPALTTRGFGEAECAEVANLIADLLAQPNNPTLLENTRRRVMHLCECFPVYLLS
ncbi:serine hydroxymethyltransferase [Pseudomonas fluorescens]|uniref:serine hydroxymethyltransferase n=1 Tax=Pseudomonas TaxID=286 RepID=UPI000DD3BAF9|nr:MULTISPECIES: serine hydroxymethyltransferase [Pseudomonas]MBD8193333.1 serine hydroxymethyltransferase [Pseudomonas fluorescens]MBD8228579.1 serine hydroxymethyltransferase [Pseudomonas fluorescens]MBD8236915.1 serine hydroxymethyltransferase [Pseudomonas fluorescens]MBD8786550.1 serine hydroxymethyltransferase [Pseudomonas fluorescens]MBD8818350.1 serine hydroxymethyltransferase [Pseudomonas fluorescens]